MHWSKRPPYILRLGAGRRNKNIRSVKYPCRTCQTPSYLEYRPAPWVIVEIMDVYHSGLRRPWIDGARRPSSNVLFQKRSDPGGDNHFWTCCLCSGVLCLRHRRGAHQMAIKSRIIEVKSIHYCFTERWQYIC